MINNEFHLIGTAISNYNDISNGKYVSHLLRLEIEKFGSKAGNSFEIEVQIYGTNKAVDTSIDILGEQVAVNGYVDSFATKEGTIITKLVAQNVYVLSKNKNNTVSHTVASTPAPARSSESTPQQTTEAEVIDAVVDDDLPF